MAVSMNGEIFKLASKLDQRVRDVVERAKENADFDKKLCEWVVERIKHPDADVAQIKDEIELEVDSVFQLFAACESRSDLEILGGKIVISGPRKSTVKRLDYPLETLLREAIEGIHAELEYDVGEKDRDYRRRVRNKIRSRIDVILANIVDRHQ